MAMLSSPPPFLRHPNHSTEPQHGRSSQSFLSSNSVILVVGPLTVIVVLAAAVSLLVIVCRVKSRKSSNISNCASSFRKGSFDRTQIPIYSTNGISYGYSPDVRSCIQGRKLGFPMQVRCRRGQVFTYKELEQATEGFRDSNVIGNGGFGGLVFRGTLNDGTVTAIKMLQREGKQGERDFRTEVDLLSRLHSGHLVGLIGYCADQHHRLLVFEYMPNGNLRHHLHSSKSKNQNHRPLDWWTRLSIALDCARALEFLHEHTVPAVIHRDFKCSNILLDHNCRAKVSDFGMAKVGSDKINGQILTRVLGTTGYVAPEYASTGKLTTKSDVYSFGVVLLELITGRVPVDPARPQGEHVLVSWALPRLTNREKVMEMVDPLLSGQFSKKELIQVAAIAAVCVQAEADYRPLMTDVVQSLIPIVVKNSMAVSTPATPSKVELPRSSFLEKEEGSVVDLEGQRNE